MKFISNINKNYLFKNINFVQNTKHEKIFNENAKKKKQKSTHRVMG